MKKVLSLAFIAAVLLLGCSADGFFSDPVNTTKPENSVDSWSKVCKLPDGTCTSLGVKSKDACEAAFPGGLGGKLASRSECPK